MTFFKKQKYRVKIQISDCQKLEVEEKIDFIGALRNFGGKGNIRYLDCGSGYMTVHKLKFIELYT